MANVFINSILWFMKLKLTIQNEKLKCRAGTHGREMQHEPRFEWRKLNQRWKGVLIKFRRGVEKFQKLISEEGAILDN